MIPVVGELNFPYWDHCSYAMQRNGGEVSGFTTHGKVLSSSDPGAGGEMHVYADRTHVRIECRTSGDPIVFWEGDSDSGIPEARPIRRIRGCATAPAEINVTKLAPQGCICNEYDPAGCPTEAECASDAGGGEYEGWIFEIETDCPGVTTAEGCGETACYSIVKNSVLSNSCSRVTNPRWYSPEAHINCADLGNGNAEWQYSDGTGKVRAAMGPVIDYGDDDSGYPDFDKFSPPKPRAWTGISSWGMCGCSGARVSIVFRYTKNWCLEGFHPVPDSPIPDDCN